MVKSTAVNAFPHNFLPFWREALTHMAKHRGKTHILPTLTNSFSVIIDTTMALELNASSLQEGFFYWATTSFYRAT